MVGEIKQNVMHYPDGRTKSKLYRVGGSLHGVWSRWHYNGQLSFQGNYVNGRPDGMHYSWFEDGVKSHQILYDNGSSRDETQWYSNGNKRRERVGSSKIEWHSNSQIKSKFPHTMNGAWSWYKDGQVEAETYCKNLDPECNNISNVKLNLQEEVDACGGYPIEVRTTRYYENGKKAFESNSDGNQAWDEGEKKLY